ncbi:MAG: hypothetical protein IPM29_06380 [Planctomycetes bacterium]|nr:hypothetical protein [Planctomycetota bacterium]
MDKLALHSSDRATVEAYVAKKFRKFNRALYPKGTRIKKAVQYHVAAQGSPHGQEVVEDYYQHVFHQLFPLELAAVEARRQATFPIKKESSQWMADQRRYIRKLEEARADLLRWKEAGDYQLGDDFFDALRNRVAFIDARICDTSGFNAEFSAECLAFARASHESSATSRAASFEAMVGFKQDASIRFEAWHPNWGEVSAKLEQSLLAGAWASGSAKAQMSKLGLSAELQAAVAIGAQLDISGELMWTKNDFGLSLGGDAQAFFGARASGEAKLSVKARQGLAASFKAGAFAGFSAEAKGHCAFTYRGQDIARVEATAAVNFGAGAEVEASVKAPIFGPTEISFAANLTLGLGTSVGTTAAIDFTEAALAASSQFHKLVALPTLMRGYEMTLQDIEARNRHYLDKALRRIETEIESASEELRAEEKIPMEKRSLLK